MANPKLEERNASHLAYLEYKGPFDKLPGQESIEKLYGCDHPNRILGLGSHTINNQ